MKILIKGGRVVDPKNDFDKVADVLVDNGVISEIGENINADGDVTVIDAEGKIVSPGLVDMHSHLRDPGQEYKEDIESGTRSAAMGGITSIACMPNTKPVTDSEPIVTYIKTKAKFQKALGVRSLLKSANLKMPVRLQYQMTADLLLNRGLCEERWNMQKCLI